jgi:hypothetical protein
MKDKMWSDSELWDIFYKKKKKAEILMDALDYMQQYNGRSKIQCIALAMGYEQSQIESYN